MKTKNKHGRIGAKKPQRKPSPYGTPGRTFTQEDIEDAFQKGYSKGYEYGQDSVAIELSGLKTIAEVRKAAKEYLL